MELDTFDDIFLVSDSHNDFLSAIRAFSNPRRNFQRLWKRGMCSCEGVVSCDWEILCQRYVASFLIMSQRRGLAVEDLPCDIDLASKYRYDTLLSHTHTQYRDLARKIFDSILTNSCVRVRMAWSGTHNQLRWLL